MRMSIQLSTCILKITVSTDNCTTVIFFPGRRSKALVEDLAGVRRVRKAVRVRDHHEAPPGDAHRRKTVLLQGLRKAIHAEGKSQGKPAALALPRNTQCVGKAHLLFSVDLWFQSNLLVYNLLNNASK